MLGHSQSTHHQQPSTTQGGIVVSRVTNNLFTSPMPPQPPATPPYTHVQTNKENLPTNSPYYGGNHNSLGIPGFKPGDITSNTLTPISTITQPLQQKKIIAANPTAPTMMNLQPQAILNNAQQQLQQQQTRLVGNIGNNNKRINTAIQAAQPKVAQIKVGGTNAQSTVEGNISPSPKSQCGDSDDEGEDDKK